MPYTLDSLRQLTNSLVRQFGPDYEIVMHDLKKHDLEHSIIHISNGHATNYQEGDGLLKVVLETLHKDPASLKDHLRYPIRTSNGKTLKSSTICIRNKEGDSIDYLLSINHGITNLMTMGRPIKALTDTEPQVDVKQQPEQIVHNVNDLLDILIEQPVILISKPAALMSREEEATATQFLNDTGAFLIIRSGDKVSKYFGIPKSALHSYIDVNSRKSGDKKVR